MAISRRYSPKDIGGDPSAGCQCITDEDVGLEIIQGIQSGLIAKEGCAAVEQKLVQTADQLQRAIASISQN